ncbi:MAG: saccharopine dehydrogenase NADP-binding domain-containing protein, partial [Hyphomicrobium sp.]
MPRRVVLIGATGFFGRRLGARLAAMDGIDLTVTSRHADRAEDLAKGLAGGRKPTALAFERDDLESVARLTRLAPWLVIDASGPFQSANYDLARAAIGAGSHWIDLADARGYLL